VLLGAEGVIRCVLVWSYHLCYSSVMLCFSNMEAIICRPILACGGAFELKTHPRGIETLATSADPHKTAVEIGKRVYNRINSGSSNLNPCPIS
jgi:hypothetical protein